MAGCTPDETYKGRPLSEWLTRATDSDPDTRIVAFDALGHMKSSRAADACIHALKTGNDHERAAILRACLSSLPESDRISAIVIMAKDASANDPFPVICDGFNSQIALLRAKASPVLPDLKRVRAGFPPEPSSTEDQAVCGELEFSINEIEKPNG